MSGGFSDAGKADFQARINRIQSRSVDLQPVLPSNEPLSVPVNDPIGLIADVPDEKSTLGAFGLIVAFLVGILAVLAARYLRFQIIGDDPSGASELSILIEVAVAAGIGLLVGMVMRLQTSAFMTANAIGLFLALTAGHNLVHWYPDAFDRLFSSEYTDNVILMTDSNSFWLGGNSLPIGPDPEYTYGGRFEGTQWADYFRFDTGQQSRVAN